MYNNQHHQIDQPNAKVFAKKEIFLALCRYRMSQEILDIPFDSRSTLDPNKFVKLKFNEPRMVEFQLHKLSFKLQKLSFRPNWLNSTPITVELNIKPL